MKKECPGSHSELTKTKKSSEIAPLAGTSLMAQMVKNLPALWEFHPWRREWLPTPVFLPGEFH